MWVCAAAYRMSAFWASVVAESARGRNMRGCLRSYEVQLGESFMYDSIERTWNKEKDAKMIATLKSCAVAV